MSPIPAEADWSGRHVVEGSLKWGVHHGKSRITDLRELEKLDVILTTYYTVSTEWAGKGVEGSLLFQVRWRRIILDEGISTLDT